LKKTAFYGLQLRRHHFQESDAKEEVKDEETFEVRKKPQRLSGNGISFWSRLWLSELESDLFTQCCADAGLVLFCTFIA
jgi:hypothetical protein